MINKLFIKVFLFLTVVAATSCENILIEPDLNDTPENNFKVFWQEFDRYYAFFELKQIDWDSVYYDYWPQINNKMSDDELFEVLSAMSLSLKDGHVSISNSERTAQYDDFCVSDKCQVDPEGYLELKSVNEAIAYGVLPDDNLGYIAVRTFYKADGAYETPAKHDTEFAVIDDILKELKDTEGIIIDVRSNRGGLTTNAETVASRFMDKRRLYAKIRYRNGPEHNDFTDFYESYVSPQGETQYTKPLVVLTNRKSASATEYFVLAMKTLPYVTVVGDNTAGLSAYPIYRELPNGWSYRISCWIGYTSDDEAFEESGIAPDVLVAFNKESAADRSDPFIEAGIEILQGD